MRTLTRSGFWIYLATFCLVIIGSLYIVYRRAHPLMPAKDLIAVQSKYAFHNDDPCLNAVYGEPFVPPTDSYIKVIIYCPNGNRSVNTIRFSTLPPNPTLADACRMIATINSFPIVIDTNGQGIKNLGSIENQAEHRWQVLINDEPTIGSIDNIRVKGTDTISLRYE